MNRIIALIGVILIILGIVALVHPSFTYHQTEEVAKLGSLRATVNEEKTATVPTAVSVVVLVSGIVLTVLSARRGK